MKLQEQELLKLANNVVKNSIFTKAGLNKNSALLNVEKDLNKLLKFALFVKNPLLFLGLLLIGIKFAVWHVGVNILFTKYVPDAERLLGLEKKILNIVRKNAGVRLFTLNA